MTQDKPKITSAEQRIRRDERTAAIRLRFTIRHGSCNLHHGAELFHSLTLLQHHQDLATASPGCFRSGEQRRRRNHSEIALVFKHPPSPTLGMAGKEFDFHIAEKCWRRRRQHATAPINHRSVNRTIMN